MRKVLGCLPLLLLGLGGTAQAYDINTYAVSNFRPCGASNLPATIREMERFYDSEHFPEDARKNFLWTDSQVRQSDWAAETDAFQSDQTANGMDGVDSSLLAYIASHGVTSGGVYSAISGTSSDGGCYMSTDDMFIGDQYARYTILSTCQGLKIGSGSNPSRPGEDPSDTWSEAAPGLNCIFGYSNNMMDDDGYGEYLLENLAAGEDTLAEAFFSASRQVSYYNIPVTMCFGADEDTARYHLENMSAFTSDRVGGDVSVWSYRNSRQVTKSFQMSGVKPTSVAMSIPNVQLRSMAGNMKFDESAGKLTFRGTKSAQVATTVSDSEAIAIAESYVAQNGFDATAWDLAPTFVIDKGTKIDGEIVVTEKMVVFHQRVGGMPTLGTAGSFEVNVGSDGAVTGATFAPRTLTVVEQKSAAVTFADLEKAQTSALANLQAANPEAELRIINATVGLDAGSFMESKTSADTILMVEVEVAQGGVARNFVERIRL